MSFSIKDFKKDFKALNDIGLVLFIYQTIIRFFIVVIFVLSYSFFINWILKNPGEDYVFITGIGTLNYIHIDKFIIVLILFSLLFLFSFFIETFGVVSLSRQYYKGEKTSLRKTFLDIIKYFRLNFKVQVLKYAFIIFNLICIGFFLYLIYLILPNIFGFFIGVYVVIKNIIIVFNKIIDYKDITQRVFEDKKNIFDVYVHKTARKKRKIIIKFYILKIFLIIFCSVFLPIIWLFITWLICKISISHEFIISVLLGLNSTIFIFIGVTLSYLYISYFSLRATRIYLEYNGEIAKKTKKYSQKNLKNLNFLLFLLIFSSFLLESLFYYGYFREKIIKDKEITIFAHRASTMTNTNNSIEALKYSIKNNVGFVEIDVQLSKEKIPVIFHDYTYFDGKQKKYINNTPLLELKNFDLKTNKNSSSEKREKIPTLEEFLKVAKGKINVNIEIKTTKNFEMELAEKVAFVVKKLDMEENVIITSFDYKILEKIKKLLPKVKTGLIITAYIGELDEIADMKVDWLMVNNVYYSLYKGTFDDFKDKKIALWSFSSNFKGTSVIYKDNLNGVIVDDPVNLAKEIKKYNKLSPGEKYYKQIENMFLKD